MISERKVLIQFSVLIGACLCVCVFYSPLVGALLLAIVGLIVLFCILAAVIL